MDPISPGFLLVAIIAAYLLPTVIAMLRMRTNMVAIFALNLFVGWTLIGWVMALVWALSSEAAPAKAAAGELPPAPWSLKRCPACAEKIQRKALVCRYCGADVEGFKAARGRV
jgi:hypothetical protein